MAGQLQKLAENAEGDDAARMRGVAAFLIGDFEVAATAFASIGRPDARDLNDLAAAELAVAQQKDDASCVTAVAALDRAIAADPQILQAHFNRAAAIEHLGLREIARIEWQRYLAADTTSSWSAAARQRARFVKTDAEAWRAYDFDALSAADLARLAPTFPQHVRISAESLCLAAWADAMVRGDSSEARRQIERARAVGEVLRTRGESLLAETVAAIDNARDTAAVELLVAGHRAYRDGRVALRDGDYAAAERYLRRASGDLSSARSPKALAAAAYLGQAIRNQNRTAEALRFLQSLHASIPERYKALGARVQHEIALCEAVLGHWSASLTAAQRATRSFSELGERGFAAAAEAILSENYDFLGQPELAWKHGLSALRAACAAGEGDRPRVIVAALTRIEMRGRRWDRARAMARLETEMAAAKPDPRHDPGMLLRRAAIESHLGNLSAARRNIAAARHAANRIHDVPTRLKLLADIDGAAGAIERDADPRRAVVLLSQAIAFQQKAGQIFLPELRLERGRAYRNMDELRAAARDFEDGIRELERQRTHVHDADLRPGIFDDAFELFQEAVSLQLRTGAGAEAVLATVERGRARAVVEQIDAEDLPSSTSIPEVQKYLGATSALIEYVVLPDRLLMICILPQRVILRATGVGRTALSEAVDAFLANVDSATAGARLYEMLIAPIAAELRAITAIAIVPDDVLQRVPFAALRPHGSAGFLVEERTVATSPSARVYVATAKRLARLGRTPPASIAVFANPAIPRDAFPLLPSLQASEYEAAAAKRMYPHGDLFVRGEATAEQFMKVAPRREVVHFAGHADVRHSEPAASSLVCASSPRVHGALTARQIARMRFQSTQTVVLAACSTMTGRNAAVEGVPSLARAFIVAGVPSVIGTLWEIDDTEAARIVRPLHEQLARGVFPAQALRSAQVAAIRAKLPVRQWAAFAAMGAAQN